MLQASLPPAPYAGGVGYQVDLLATTLARRGHEVTAFVVDQPPARSAYRCVQLHLAPGRGRRLLGVGRLYARLDLSRFDVVHAHGDDWLFGRRPRVRTFHGSALAEAWSATRWDRRGAQLCHYALEWVSSLNRNSVAVSRSTRRYLPLVRSVVPCAYDAGLFFPGGERSASPSILNVSRRLGGRKRGELLLRSFAEVRRALPGARLTIVSQDRVEAPGVTCRSNVEAAELGALYRSHWLLCSTSSYEGFGVPYLEALASGLPVVTTPNAGALEVLQGGRLGVVSAPGDLGRALVALVRDAPRRRALGDAGLPATRGCSAEEVADEYERLYESIATVAGR